MCFETFWVSFGPSTRSQNLIVLGRWTWFHVRPCTLEEVQQLTPRRYIPAVSSIAQDFGVSDLVARLPTATYLFGFSLGPVVWSPVAEDFGRKKVFVGCLGMLYIVRARLSRAFSLFSYTALTDVSSFNYLVHWLYVTSILRYLSDVGADRQT